jgi:FkbM family methyltransferase
MQRLSQAVQRLLGRLGGAAPEPAPLPSPESVTEQDIHYCYRLLLEREPDPDGLRDLNRMLQQGTLTRSGLVQGFLDSIERRALEVERARPVWVDLGGFGMFVRTGDPHIGRPIALHRSYEPHVSAQLRAALREECVFVDVGANIGYFSLLAASLVGARGRVIALEPREDNVELLRRSAATNGFMQIDIQVCAAAERSCELVFFASGAVNSNGRVAREDEPFADLLPRVHAVALDELLADVPRIDLIKLDIEGSEPRALEGMRKLIDRHRPLLLSEFSPELIRVAAGQEPVAYLEALARTHLLFTLPLDGSAERGPLEPREVLAAQEEWGLQHVDLLARPR